MILSQSSADKMLRRMATEIAEHNFGREEIIVIGIRESGTFIAGKIEEYLKGIFPGKITTLALGIDKKHPEKAVLSEPADLGGKIILLADDVANSGRTMLYAMQSFLEHYPAEIQTLALVERTHKLFPVALNYRGISVSTTELENITVNVEDGVITGAGINSINS